MKNLKKILLISLLIFVFSFGFVSCKEKTTDTKPGANTGVDDNVIYSPYVITELVLGDGVDKNDAAAITRAYYKLIGREITITDAESTAAHKIIVGKTDDELSDRAYRLLSRIRDDGEVGYAIVSDGSSVAIAFDADALGESIAQTVAIKYFISGYMQSPTLKLDNDVIFYDSFDAIEKQSERDATEIDILWSMKLSQISEKVEDEEKANAIINGLKNIRGLLNSDHNTVVWLANLYDPETGGFYYSNSARNNEGYLPDLESTAQALGIIESILTGYGGTLTDYFGEEIAEKFVSFAKDMQNQNGYFYHPQWSREAIDKNTLRRTRDLLNALSILDFFGATPTYDTPNGVQGYGIATTSSCLTLPLGQKSSVSAVAAVADGNDEIYIPAHLKSSSAFSSYLSGLDIQSNTSDVAETLYNELPLYIKIDEMLEESGEKYRLCEMLYNYISSKQHHYTGLWCSTKDDSFDEIAELTGVIKICSGIGKAVPNYQNIVETILTHLRSDEEIENIEDLSSLWSAFGFVVNNVISYSEELYQPEVKAYLNGVYAEFDVILSNTRKALSKFLRDDGSYSTTQQGSLSEAYGMPVAVPLSEEGDVSATLAATKTIWLAIFNVLDLGSVPVFTTSDRMAFQQTLLDMGVIIKNEIKEIDPIDFEDCDLDEYNDVIISGSGMSTATVVSAPEHDGNALRIYSPAEKGSVTDLYRFGISSTVNSPTCFTVELDMCVLPETSEAMFLQLNLYYDIYFISLVRSGDTIRLSERSDRGESTGYVYDLGVEAQVGEWFNLRIEYYPGTASTVRTKLFFNDRCVTVSDIYFYKHNSSYAPSTNFQNFALYACSSKTTDVLIDNLITESSYKTYTPETSDELNRNIDAPDASQKMQSFETTEIGASPSGFVNDGDASAVAVSKDADGNKSLCISEAAGELVIPLYQRGAGANSATLEFDITLDAQSEAGTKYQINFKEYFHKNWTLAAMQILVVEENGEKYATIAEVSSGNTGTIYSNVKLSLGVKYRLGFRLFFDDSAVVTSLDGEIVGIGSSAISKCYERYMGKITVSALTSDIPSAIYIDNLISERVHCDFDEFTSPTIPRVEYGCDQSDGMELSGAVISGGAVAFEQSGGSDTYVQIPVNKRVNTPTMALAGFDYNSSANATGSITAAFTDSSGNVITAFDILVTSAGAEIYEHTEKGRYGTTPIHTVTKAAFNISIEYSAEKQSFNILVDGKYVAASSLIYKEGSDELDVANFRISANYSSGVTVDNLYAEKIIAMFLTHTVSMTNTDSTSAVMTYETSSFASLPSKIQMNFGTTSAYARIKQSTVKNAVSKVLEFYIGDSGGSSVTFFKTETSSGTNAVFFETDMMLKETSGGFWIKMEFLSSSALASYFDLRTFGSGSSIEIRNIDKVDGAETVEIKEGQWFNVRVEYRDVPSDFNYDGYNDCLLRVYINGTLVGEKTTPASVTNVQSTAVIRDMRVRNYDGTGIICFDNTRLGECSMSYDEPIPADTHTLTYEPGFITNKTTFAFGGTGSTSAISKMTVNGEVTKVLSFYTAKSSLDKLSIKPTVTSDTANALVFETDIMISPEEGTHTFYLEPMTEKNKQPIRLIIKAESGGNITVSSKDISETVIGKSGEWIHLKVEYMCPSVDYNGDGRADILYKVYADDMTSPAAVGYEPYVTGAYYDPLSLEKLVFTAEYASNANIYLDNTRFWQVELTPDEAPTFSGSGDAPIGGTTTDGDGWT